MELPIPTDRSAMRMWSVGLVGIAAIGVADYYSGIELRVFPLYYVPLSLLAWQSGWMGAATATVLCGGSWLASNVLAGMTYAHATSWVVNTAMQTASFATVALLIAVVRGSLLREQVLSRRDHLTNMLNRMGFYEEADRLIALCRRKGRPLTVAYIDLDNFKSVNDSLGHERGDEVLQLVADQLAVAIRPSDVAARLGGDEFMVLFPELGEPEAAVALERIRAQLEEALPAETTSVSASVGGVVFAQAPPSMDEIVRASDAQMYRAKAGGRNRVELHVSEAQSRPPSSTRMS